MTRSDDNPNGQWPGIPPAGDGAGDPGDASRRGGAAGNAGGHPDRPDMCDATGAAGRLRAEQEALTAALHEGPVQNFTMLGIRLEQARAQLARGEVAETARALSSLQLALANEISTLRRLLTPDRRKAS